MAKPSDFVLLQNGFIFNGCEYRDAEVEHIEFELSAHTIKTNFVTTGHVDTARLELYLTNGKKIDVYSKSGFAPLVLYFKDKPNERLDIIHAYQQIASRTFQQRLSPFVKQIEANGYFTYNSAQFYPREKIVIKGKEHKIQDTAFQKNSGNVYLNKKSPGFLDKVSKQWDGGPHFAIDKDKDVLFFLLDKLFGVRWP